jgi:large repetitive protein
MRELWNRSSSMRWAGRLARVLALALVLTFAVGVAGPGEPVGRATSGLSWSGVAAWLSAFVDVSGVWAEPSLPSGPKQRSGTAVGRGHTVPADATRAGGGTGKAPGKGRGELAAYTPPQNQAKTGASAAKRGYDAATSRRNAAKSTATSTYYDNADGSYTRKYNQGVVNYRDASGGWQAIDAKVQRGGDGRFHQAANSLNLQFAGYADDPAMVLLGADTTHAVSQRLVGAGHVAGVQKDTTVTFPAVLPGTDLRLQSRPTGEMEELVLHDANAPSSWEFELGLTGLTASLAKNGSIVLADAAGHTVVTIPAGYAYDSKVDPVTGDPAMTRNARYELTTVGGTTRLKVSLDQQWLHDPARKFPVTVDPSYMNEEALTTYAMTGDGFTGDREYENVINIGSYDSGVHAARSFLQFPYLGLDNSHSTVSAAELDIFDTWATVCTPERFDVAPVTAAWTPSSVTTYPGPALGASIGNLTPSVPHACANTGADRSVGDWLAVTLAVATFNNWSNGTSADYGLGIYAATNNTLTWKRFGSVMSQSGGPSLYLTYTGLLFPQVLTQNPPNGALAGSLTPQLSAEGTIDLNLGLNVQFDYQVYDANGTKVADSGLVPGAYSVPAGKLRWGQTYYWSVQASDGTNYSPNPQWYQLSTQVPQPSVTSTLSQNPGHGYDASIGNYTTSATDIEVATAGPALSVDRNYNSRDPRTFTAFGAAWTSMFDARATERYDPTGAVYTVVVTYPDGSDVAYGRNADGSFTAGPGRASTLIRMPTGYELIDKSGTTYSFAQSLGSGAFGISKITDSAGRAASFTWTSNQITAMTSAVSGRAVHLTWSTPSGATSAHVATVSTDPATAGQSGTAYTWTYGYTGDRLSSVCPPGTTTACTRYNYSSTAASQTRNQVLDKGAHSYWPLAETTGTTAVSAIVANEGTDNATYVNTTLGTTVGPLSSSPVTGATLNGTDSEVTLPDLRMSSSLAQSVSFWFNAAPGTPAGVLFSYSSMPISATAKSGNSMPVIYLGTDGKLLGEYWISSSSYAANPITTTASVADGHWHHVLLTGSQTAQTMYVDGAQVGTIPGWGALGLGSTTPWQWHFNYLGTGFLGPSVDGNGVWPDQPHTALDTLYASYFKGSIADAAFFDNKVLTATDATALYQAGTRQSTLLTSITRPSGKTYSTVNYEKVSATVTQVTDENGGTWGLAPPSVTGSSQVYRSAVLGGGPFAYYRMGDAAGSAQAFSEVHYTPGTYANATVGVAGPFSDYKAASFNGTSSSLRVPSETFSAGSTSQSLWFNTKSSGSVLLSSQNSAIGGTTCPCLPAMWITSDGKLRSLSPSTTPNGPFVAKGFTNKCVDDSGSQTANGTKVQIFTCNGTAAQNWTMMPDGSVRAFGKCLDLSGYGTTNGTKVQLWDCTGATNQVWQAYNGGLRNPVSGRCLDDPSSSTTDGTQFQLYDCNGSNAQLWLQGLASPKAVTDGNWHHAVLTSTGTVQSLYVDGALAQASTGQVTLTPGPQPYAYVGAGYTGTSASGLANNAQMYFNGSIAEASFYRAALTGAQVSAQFAAAKNSTGTTPMSTVTITDPGGKALKSQYDVLNGNRLIGSIDGLGNKTSYGYDASGFLYTATDPNGNVTTTGHDDAGNVVSKTTCQNQVTNACSTEYATYRPTSMGVDVAKGGTVTASSSYVAGGWKQAALTDGNVASVSDSLGWTSSPQTSATAAQWVQVDMGAVKTIDQVALYRRTDGVGGFPSGFNIQISVDGSTWTTVTTQSNYPVPSTGIPAVFGFNPASARYVKVNGTTLRTDGSSSYFMQFAELTALNDRPDPTAGELLTSRDARSSSATDNTYLTSYGYDAIGNMTSATTPPVAGFPSGRISTVAYTDGTTVAAADGGFAPAGLPYRTTSPGGAANTVSYLRNGDIASTTDADGLVTRYTYDNLGRVLTKTVVSDSYPSGLTTTYTYDADNQVVSQTDPPVNDRVTGAVHTAQITTVYDADGNVTSQTVADTTGGDASRVYSTTYNTFNQVASKTDPVGNTTTFTYDAYGNKASDTDALTNIVRYTFDPNGHLLTQTLTNYTGDPVHPQAAAALLEVSRAYDPAGRLAAITNAMGNTTTYTYTDNGLVARVTRTDSNGQNPYVEKSDTYDAAGHITSEVTNNGATTTVYTVDAAARTTGITLDPAGVNRTSAFTYTPDDAVATNTISDGAGITYTTSATYTPMGRTKSKSVSSNLPGYTATLTTTWTLDQRGLATSQTDPNGNVITTTYDEAGRLAVTTGATVNVETDGNPAVAVRPTTIRGYDTFGSQVEAQDANGNVTTTSYNANGRAVQQVRPNYTPPGGASPIVALVTNQYDALGNLIRATDPLGHVTQYLYDQLGDLAQTTDPDGGITYSTFDANGERMSVTDPTGAQAQATYDHLGRLVTSTVVERQPSAVALTTTNSYAASATNPGGAWLASSTSPLGVVTAHKYNAVGEETGIVDGAGNTTSSRYDLFGRRVATVLPDNSSSTVSFDQAGNAVATKNLDPAGAVLTSRSATYDANGNQLSSTDGRGTTSTYTYDSANIMTGATQPVDATSSITTSFGHDPVGNRTRFTDGRNNSWITTYNSWLLPESTIEPATATFSSAPDRTSVNTYDAGGHAVTQTSPGGVTITNTFDVMGRLVTASGSGADAPSATRTLGYDLDGRLTSAQTDAVGDTRATTETYAYDDRGDLLNVTGDAGSSSFAYNNDGSMTSRADASGTTTYGYEGTGRLNSINDAVTGTTLTLSYNTLSQVTAIQYGSGGNTRTFGYDGLHRLGADTLKTPANATVASITYGYDANNNVTSKTTTGFAGDSSNTYAYDLANRLTSWNNGTTALNYGYDASSNRIQVGANVYTYDARDQLTGDGSNTYTYTARGTRATQNGVQFKSDAFSQDLAMGSQSYTYDALGRTLTESSDGTTRQFSYSGLGNTIAADGTNTYSRDPGGALLGIGSAGGSAATGVLAYTDQHSDVVGDFTGTGTSLAGSTAYDPLGNVLATSNQAGHLGYQSGWTDPGNSKVNMAARWYSPEVGQFMNKDTASNDPVPNPAEANPFAYVDDNPMTGTDPSGHSWLSSAWHATTSTVSSAWHATTSAVSTAWNATTSFVSSTWHTVTSAASSAWNWTKNTYNATIKKITDAYNREMKQLQAELKRIQNQIKALNAEIKKRAAQAVHVVKTAYHATATAVKTAGTFVKNHAAAIGEFVVTTAVFMGCEAVLGAATGGVGAVAGAVACGALSGAVGGLMHQGIECAEKGKQACSAGAFLKAGVVGGVVGGLSGLGGALGGKLLSAVGGRALQAVGGLFGRGGAEAAEGAATSVAEGATEGVAEGAAESGAEGAAENAARSGSEDAAGAGRGAGEAEGSEPSSAGRENGNGGSCKAPTHSFTGATPVLLADGRTKTIGTVRAGDRVTSSVPGERGVQTHTVQKVVVTTTDHDFVDVTIAAAKAGGPDTGRASRLGVLLASSAAALVTVAGPATGAVLTTTYHHPFYDRTQSAFVEAQYLRAGDELQTPSGTAVVLGVRLYHTSDVTYDLTIDGLHTYYVLAGEVPVLVHNCGDVYEHGGSTRYHGLDGEGRATGMSTQISKADLAAREAAGTPANPSIEPSGWSGNGSRFNEARGHLLADRLGGNGDLEENLVTLTHDPVNSPIMRDEIEDVIYKAVDAGETIQYTVIPEYAAEGDLAPIGLRIMAYGNKGFKLERYLENPAGMFHIE